MKCPTCNSNISCLTCPFLALEQSEDEEIANLRCTSQDVIVFSYYWRRYAVEVIDCVCDEHPVMKRMLEAKQ